MYMEKKEKSLLKTANFHFPKKKRRKKKEPHSMIAKEEEICPSQISRSFDEPSIFTR
jgi:hypothetical protein